jgi:hypothetical protein
LNTKFQTALSEPSLCISEVEQIVETLTTGLETSLCWVLCDCNSLGLVDHFWEEFEMAAE